MGVVNRRWMWVESIRVVSGCGCKEVYRFPKTFSFLILYFLVIKFYVLIFRAV